MEIYHVLKPEWAELAHQWKRDYDNCSCFISPPCSSCMHEGHPLSLEETPEAWEAVYDIGSVEGTIKSEFQVRYLLDATSVFNDNAFHLTMCAYSVNRALGGPK